ncbi:hypothetical protein SAMN04515671_3026 [Nakamurella panacisegetis]|uniref:Probable membrane transporter protein n=1 Tax=Nakamurella panacisegetis TaxID=1090615 RepID=A0A1H0Q957_9ACTN|nr:sulfite exporter TauE/SafE family protein [Nakamurella panacisegetis]SDP13901.1 hypothetical protein SAMN04515671_3026 [Nakamurella panacisegetis]
MTSVLGSAAMLLAAGFGAGITGSTAGLASLISYPALLALGLPPVTANVTNTVALIGSSVGSVSGSRSELRGQGPDIRRWIGIAIIGGALGATLLLTTPPGVFQHLVPYLVAGASVLLLASPSLRAIRAKRSKETAALEHSGPLVPVTLFFTCLYGGYFGAAAGVMILALLLLGTDKSLPAANAVKNLLLGVANAVAAVGFAVFADVRWAAVVPLGIGCVLGGRIGPAIVRRVPPTLMRTVIAVAGFALAVKLWLD